MREDKASMPKNAPGSSEKLRLYEQIKCTRTLMYREQNSPKKRRVGKILSWKQMNRFGTSWLRYNPTFTEGNRKLLNISLQRFRGYKTPE